MTVMFNIMIYYRPIEPLQRRTLWVCGTGGPEGGPAARDNTPQPPIMLTRGNSAAAPPTFPHGWAAAAKAEDKELQLNPTGLRNVISVWMLSDDADAVSTDQSGPVQPVSPSLSL